MVVEVFNLNLKTQCLMEVAVLLDIVEHQSGCVPFREERFTKETLCVMFCGGGEEMK